MLAGFTCAAAPNWQARPQTPQLALLLARFSSQPSHGSPSQLSRSVPQTGWHTPLAQVFDVVPDGDWQARPHTPQLPSSFWRLTQRPLQNVCPWGHWQTLDTHVRPPVQALLHMPQCVLLDDVSTQEPPHSVSPPVH
jgi:hypothetical protein